MSGKQESIADYFEEAREIARAEKALGFEQWDRVSICRNGDKEGESFLLYSYDLPRILAEKYEWVIRWRAAKLQCQYPRYNVTTYHGLYRKIAGCNIGMQEDINKLIASKAMVTKQVRKLEEYITQQRLSNLFFDESSDELVIKYKAKVERNKLIVSQAEARLKAKLEQYKLQNSIN